LLLAVVKDRQNQSIQIKSLLFLININNNVDVLGGYLLRIFI